MGDEKSQQRQGGHAQGQQQPLPEPIAAHKPVVGQQQIAHGGKGDAVQAPFADEVNQHGEGYGP